MHANASVTQWIGQARHGDAEAVRFLWERYFHRLIELARPRLRSVRFHPAGAEDVALSALDSFFRRAEQGQFEQLRDRGDLWSLLVAITLHKAAKAVQNERAGKRGSGEVRGDSALSGTSDAEGSDGFEQVPAKGPGPELAAQFAEQCQRLLDALKDPTLRAVALWRMEGYSNLEIADNLGVVTRSVERKLNAIRKIWEREGGVQ